MAGKSTPLVSIGLPVYNGEAYLEEAIASIAGQTFGDWELVLADNASTDGTAEICDAWSQRDERIRWERAEENCGAAPNFNRSFHLCGGRYFRWHAHDDLVEPTYLERCVELLGGDESIVLAHSEMVEIGVQGETLRPLDARIRDMEAADLVARFRGAIALDHGCFDVFGLIRREALARTQLIAPYLGSDRTLLAELALQGRLVRAPEVLFHSREHPQRSIRIKSDRERERWFGASHGKGRLRHGWRRLREVRSVLAAADVPFGARQRCRMAVLEWALQQKGTLVRELIGRAPGAAKPAPAPTA